MLPDAGRRRGQIRVSDGHGGGSGRFAPEKSAAMGKIGGEPYGARSGDEKTDCGAEKGASDDVADEVPVAPNENKRANSKQGKEASADARIKPHQGTGEGT